MTGRTHALKDSKAMRGEALDKVRHLADRSLNDTRLDSWRTPGRQRAIVIAAFLCVAATVWATAQGWSIISLGLVLIDWGFVWLLRRLVRAMADLPEEFIDERMLQVRDRAYRHSYMAVVGGLAVITSVAMLVMDFTDELWVVNSDQMFAGLWGVLMIGMMLPSAIIAWTEPRI